MILTDLALDKLKAQGGDWLHRYEEWPLAFFGWAVKYPKQAEIVRRWLDEKPVITVVTGWKRTGKTKIAAFLGACWLMGELNPNWPGAKSMGIKEAHKWTKKHGGDRIGLIGGSSMDHINGVLLEEYRALIPRGAIKTWFSAQRHHITTHKNGRFVVRSYDQKVEEWKSGAYHFIHLDEEPPMEKLKECLDRIKTTKGQIIISVALDDADVSYLPEACENPMKFFGTDRFMHVQLGVEDVPDEIYPQESKEMVYRQYDETPLRNAVRKGDFPRMSGKWWCLDKDIHVIPPFKIPENWKKWRSIDAGFTAPTACLWVAMHPVHRIMFIYREFYKTQLTIDLRCQGIIEASGNTRKRDGGIWIEEQNNEQYQLTILDYHEFKVDQVTGIGLDYEWLKSGLIVSPATTFGEEARRDMMNKWLWVDQTENHFITHKPGAPRVYIMSNCENLIWEAQKKTVKKPSTERSAQSEKKSGSNRDDHSMDCGEMIACELAYCIEDRNPI